MESAGTHQGKRHYKIKRNGGLFRPPYAVTDMHTLKEQAMSRILTPTHVNTHTHTHTHQASLEVLGDG
jgi:hypothetical protein